jgi:hypothetical protein
MSEPSDVAYGKSNVGSRPKDRERSAAEKSPKQKSRVGGNAGLLVVVHVQG